MGSWSVFFFYPLDFTFVCPTEIIAFSDRIAEFAKAPLLGQVPIDSLVREWGDNGTPVVQAAPTSAPAKAFREIAERLADRVTTELFDQYGGVAPTEGPRRLPILR